MKHPISHYLKGLYYTVRLNWLGFFGGNFDGNNREIYILAPIIMRCDNGSITNCSIVPLRELSSVFILQDTSVIVRGVVLKHSKVKPKFNKPPYKEKA
jgi:hypothetical protein